MKICFGLQLDGQRGWHVGNSLNEITVGTNGMLGILETQLGLLADLVPQTQRVVQYLDCLKRCDHAKRFYHKSLEVDELGTAAMLLAWRDQWHLHGWSGEIDSTSGRLADMADVECVAINKVSPSEGERLAAIRQVMERRKPAISKVALVSPLATFPKRWQQVLSGLPTEISQIDAQQGKLFLHAVQARLRRAQAGDTFEDDDRLSFKADGSVVVVRAETRLLVSRWLAERLSQGVQDGVLVAADSAALLDNILVSAGQSRHGMSDSSAYRPALQLLPMALALLWAPLDFNVLIAFLSHPISPVRSYARRKLAGKLAAQPGIGGDEWDKVLLEITEHYGDEADVVGKQIKTWIDHPRFEQNSGVPVAEVMIRAKNLAHYFHVRLIDPDEAKRASWQAGFSQTSGFIGALELLQQSGVTVIRQRQLQKLLTQATARGSVNPKLVAEVGSLSVVSDPAALIEPFDQVFWWQPVMPGTAKSYPWSVSELKVLSDSGVDLPDIRDVLDHTAGDWLKPVFAAREQLTIILPPRDMEVHPAWQMIESLVADIPEHALEQIFKGNSYDTQSSAIVLHAPLPEAKRWWQLPENISVPRREHESYSSLELFLFNPYQWLLRYPAGLKASNLLSVSDGFLLDGQLAHAVVERFFALPNSLGMPEAEVLGWFDATFHQVVETQGAVLLMDGRRSDYEGLRYRLRRALTRLLAQMKAADVVTVQPELELNGSYPGGAILGYADLVLTNSREQQAIVDMKWGGTKKYSAKLAENSHLQLGIYAEMLRQKTGAWPDVGYYVLSEAKLLTQHDHYFPESGVVISKINESTPHLWERFTQTYAWRNELLKQGAIEVVLESTVPEDEFNSPEDGLAPEYLNPNYNDYLILAGGRDA
jgi:hypothetical protein